MAEEKKQPVNKFKAGVIEVAVWENKSDKGDTWLSISHKRSYKDKEGNWCDTQTYSLNDLPVLVMLMQEAYKYGKLRL